MKYELFGDRILVRVEEDLEQLDPTDFKGEPFTATELNAIHKLQQAGLLIMQQRPFWQATVEGLGNLVLRRAALLEPFAAQGPAVSLNEGDRVLIIPYRLATVEPRLAVISSKDIVARITE
jgi:hypothetical protein